MSLCNVMECHKMKMLRCNNSKLYFEYIQSTGEEEGEDEEENEAGEEDKEVISPDIIHKDIQVLYPSTKFAPD